VWGPASAGPTRWQRDPERFNRQPAISNRQSSRAELLHVALGKLQLGIGLLSATLVQFILTCAALLSYPRY